MEINKKNLVMNTRKLSSRKLPVMKSKQNTLKQFGDSKCSKSES